MSNTHKRGENQQGGSPGGAARKNGKAELGRDREKRRKHTERSITRRGGLNKNRKKDTRRKEDKGDKEEARAEQDRRSGGREQRETGEEGKGGKKGERASVWGRGHKKEGKRSRRK